MLNKKLPCQSCFNRAELGGLFFVMIGRNRLPKIYHHEFIVRISNETGWVFSRCDFNYVIDEQFKAGDFNFDSRNIAVSKNNYLLSCNEMYLPLEAGLYKVEVSFFGETVISALFTIGDHDIYAQYAEKRIRTNRTGLSGKTVQAQSIEDILSGKTVQAKRDIT